MKKLTGLTILLLAAVLLISCSAKADVPASNGNTETEAVSVKAVDAVSIAALIDEKMSNASKLSAVGDEYLTGILELDMAQISEYVLKIQTAGTESDQYGIFRAVDEKAAKSLAESIEGYLETLKASWEQFDYLPEEGPKIKNAQVLRNGGYVLYIIASDSEKSEIIKIFDSNTAA